MWDEGYLTKNHLRPSANDMNFNVQILTAPPKKKHTGDAPDVHKVNS